MTYVRTDITSRTEKAALETRMTTVRLRVRTVVSELVFQKITKTHAIGLLSGLLIADK